MQSGHAAAFTAGGDLVVAASNEGTIDIGGQPLHTSHAAFAVARLAAADGQPKWARQFECAYDHFGTLGLGALAADDDTVWLATYNDSGQPGLHSVDFGLGPVHGNYYLVALDSADGGAKWQRPFTSFGGFYDVARDSGDAVIVAGGAADTLDLGGGLVVTNGAAIVAKYGAADGDFRWARIVGDHSWNDAHGVDSDAQGHVYVGGTFAGTMFWGDQQLVAQPGGDGFLAKLLP
ncbi:hypothetical protein SAMN02745121_00910 [Nannocystis exedens]|uniref:PQQ-like domain-containing protein n=1 Tax=Nannocystis exedens TaxID=54 RepID=A0A1I1UAD3_9BACT|nr:hypothetical protein [Nannocystis exedens]PCC71369.1 hypothetical protein NAEX_04445 [Nannocystis exedens]SFD64890.1 hypothetical protein SAMN02745121_00910 [Nannocystis exedens]